MDEELRLIPRVEFATRFFPQAACTGCCFRKVCTNLLAPPLSQLEGDFWLVRGEAGECARHYSEPLPLDIRSFRRREIGRLTSMSGDSSGGGAIAKRRRVVRATNAPSVEWNEGDVG